MLRIQKAHAQEMIAHALEEDPNECCGVLAGSNGRFHKLFRMTNVEHSPYRYSWDSRELFRVWREMEENGWEHRAVYHSHTHSPAYPSATDIRLAAWPDAYYILISLMDKKNPTIRAFRITNGQVTEEELVIED